MKLLILGGTRFVGRHITEAALERGHQVTLFNRGQSNPDLFPGVENLQGDRDGGLDALRGKTWDAVIDVNGYLPRVVRDSAELLKDAVEHYVFVSTISVFKDNSEIGINESSELIELDDPTTENRGEHYGGLKVLCERAVQSIFPGRSLIIRPGIVAGPHDPTYRFTYWPLRISQGGEMLVPNTPDYKIQTIDGRDLAAFTIAQTEKKANDVFNVTGPQDGFTLKTLVEASRQIAGADTTFTWVDPEFLGEQGVQMWQDLPLWVVADDLAGLFAANVQKSVLAGLTFRPLEDTIRDTLTWVQNEEVPAERPGLTREREAEILAAWHNRA
jgi:2'-hydroxyisoflavone reductase